MPVYVGWCPYCQKVWLLLELKEIPYRVEKVPMNAYGDKPAWYTRKVNGGKLPAVEIDGELHVESLDIMRKLDQTFENHGPRMVPPPTERERFEALLLLEKELHSAWFTLVFYPIEGEALQKANQTFLDTLARVDHELSATDGPWFLGGEAPSLVDLQYVTHMERIIPSVLYWKALSIRHTGNFPHLDQWLSAMEELPAYLSTRSDYYTHVMVMPSQNGPGYMIPQAKSIAAKICGLASGSWHLPLDLNESLEHFAQPACSANSIPAEEAAFHLIANHDKVVLFACRGAGAPGRPAFHAELADPYAEPNKDYSQAVDVCLRHVVHALLTGTTESVIMAAKKDLAGMPGNDELRENWEAYPDEATESLTYYWNYETGDVTWTPPTQQLDTCLTYLRDRIGVPRDMSAAAAMQLRAFLNWAIDVMRDNY
jgi:glutathione S-transferase